MEYLLESFDDFCGGEEFIIESTQHLKDMQKAYIDVKKAMGVLSDATSKLKSEIYYFEDNAPTPESKAAADDAYSEIKGNFQYVLDGDLNKYWDNISDSLDKAIKGASVKAKSYKVRIPKEASFTKDDLSTILRALEIDKHKADHELYYEDGSSSVMMKNKSGGSFGSTSMGTHIVITVLRKIIDFMKNGNKKVITKWIKFMKDNTGYTFSFDPDFGYTDDLYIKW